MGLVDLVNPVNPVDLATDFDGRGVDNGVNGENGENGKIHLFDWPSICDSP